MIKEAMKDGDIMDNSANNIVFMDYRTSATAMTDFESSARSDSLANITKNNNIVYCNMFLTDNTKYLQEPQ